MQAPPGHDGELPQFSNEHAPWSQIYVHFLYTVGNSGSNKKDAIAIISNSSEKIRSNLIIFIRERRLLDSLGVRTDNQFVWTERRTVFEREITVQCTCIKKIDD